MLKPPEGGQKNEGKLPRKPMLAVANQSLRNAPGGWNAGTQKIGVWSESRREQGFRSCWSAAGPLGTRRRGGGVAVVPFRVSGVSVVAKKHLFFSER
ncbi:MAG: hypothetical protein HHAS10_02800 [Candidatus Altimarinota bacterium]